MPKGDDVSAGVHELQHANRKCAINTNKKLMVRIARRKTLAIQRIEMRQVVKLLASQKRINQSIDIIGGGQHQRILAMAPAVVNFSAAHCQCPP